VAVQVVVVEEESGNVEPREPCDMFVNTGCWKRKLHDWRDLCQGLDGAYNFEVAIYNQVLRGLNLCTTLDDNRSSPPVTISKVSERLFGESSVRRTTTNYLARLP